MISGFAVAAAGTGTVQLMPHSQIRSWQALDGVLGTLGFRSAHADAWLALGVVPSRSTKEQATAVQRRLELARTLLTLADAQQWPEADIEQADEALRRLSTAADALQREVASTGGVEGSMLPRGGSARSSGSWG